MIPRELSRHVEAVGYAGWHIDNIVVVTRDVDFVDMEARVQVMHDAALNPFGWAGHIETFALNEAVEGWE